MHLGGTEGDAGERWSGETKMKKVTSMRVNMQRQNETDMKMQEEAEEILGGRCKPWIWEGCAPGRNRGHCRVVWPHEMPLVN